MGTVARLLLLHRESLLQGFFPRDWSLADYAYVLVNVCRGNVTSLAAQVNVYGLKNDYAPYVVMSDGVDTVEVCRRELFESKRSPSCSVSSLKSSLSASLD